MADKEKEKEYVNITKVYTKRGDKGETDLLGGSAARKDSLKVESYGCIDEASSFIGLARYYTKNKVMKERLKGIQNKMLVLGGFLASDEKGNSFQEYGIRFFPTSFIINKKGFLEGYIGGAISEDQLRKALNETLKKWLFVK